MEASGPADEELSGSAPGARATAALLQSLMRRTMEEQPLQRRGDELEVVDHVLSVWNRVPVEDTMHLQALSALITVFLPALVLTESDEPFHQARLDAAGLVETFGRLGVASWCAARGYPLELGSDALAQREERTEPMGAQEVFALVRESQDAPAHGEELEAHEALDPNVQQLLPTFRAILEKVEDQRPLSVEVRDALGSLSLTLLATARRVGSVVFPSISWGEPDVEGAEGWWAYFFATVFVALNMRLLAEATSPEEAKARLHFDAEFLDLMADRFDHLEAK